MVQTRFELTRNVGVQKASLRARPLLAHFRSCEAPLVCSDEKSFLPLRHRASARARTYDPPGTAVIWASSTLQLKHKAALFRAIHSAAPCLGNPCLVSDRTSPLPDKAAHSFDWWPDSLCNPCPTYGPFSHRKGSFYVHSSNVSSKIIKMFQPHMVINSSYWQHQQIEKHYPMAADKIDLFWEKLKRFI